MARGPEEKHIYIFREISLTEEGNLFGSPSTPKPLWGGRYRPLGDLSRFKNLFNRGEPLKATQRVAGRYRPLGDLSVPLQPPSPLWGGRYHPKGDLSRFKNLPSYKISLTEEGNLPDEIGRKQHGLAYETEGNNLSEYKVVFFVLGDAIGNPSIGSECGCAGCISYRKSPNYFF
jgi:hypothetical protein